MTRKFSDLTIDGGAAQATDRIGAARAGASITLPLSALVTLAGGTYQPLDADLTAIAALSTTAYGRALLALADAAALRTAAALGTAAVAATGDFDPAGAAAAAQAASQPLDSDLTAIAALSTTSYGRAFLALADAAAGRTALALGTLATQSGTFSGTSSGTNTGDQTNISGNAATVTTNANLTGPITSSGNATAVAAQTGTGSVFAMQASPTFTGMLTAAGITNSAMTSGRVKLSGTAGLETDSTNLTFSTSQLNVANGFYLDTGTGGGGAAKSFTVDLTAAHASAGSRYAAIDFRSYTSGLVGQFLLTGNTYSNSGINIGANGIGLLAEATSGILLLGAVGSGGVVNINTGGYGAANTRLSISAAGLTGFGVAAASATAVVHIKAGTATANTAPGKKNSGTLNTTAEVGAEEFLADNRFFTITTSAARKAYVFDDGARLTSGIIPVATTNGRLIDGPTPAADGTYTPVNSITISKGLITAIS